MREIHLKEYSNSGNPDVLKLITSAGEVLDIGCGTGDIANHLKKTGCDVDGITISESELKQARQFLREGYLFNVEKGLPEEVKSKKYDYIICSHVLEHICYPDNLLNDIKQCLKKDGKLIIALPNLLHYSSRLKLFRGDFNYEDTGIWDNTHFKWYTYETGKKLIEKNGLIVTEQFVTGLLPWNSLFSKFISEKTALKIYDRIKQLSPGLLGYQLIYVAKKI